MPLPLGTVFGFPRGQRRCGRSVGLGRPSRWRTLNEMVRAASRWLVTLLVLVIVASTTDAAASRDPSGPSGAASSEKLAPAVNADGWFRLYLVRLAESNLMLAIASSEEDVSARAWQVRRDEVAAALDRLRADGRAGTYTYDEPSHTFRVALVDSALSSLQASPHVASIEPVGEAGLPRTADAEHDNGPLYWPSGSVGPQDATTGVSSVVFVQVHSPFVWGRVNIGGLSVRLWLEDASGNVVAGASQATLGAQDGQRCSANPPSGAIKIDPNQLYFETVFRACDSNEPVMIRPGHRVHVITSGDDPSTPGTDPDEDKRITVDDIESWTSYERDTVSGTVPAGARVVVTVSNTLSLGTGYITPGTSMTFAEVTGGSDGSFTASTFRTSSDATYKTVDLRQGSRGFVRVIHANGDEVYSVHGQNVLVLENSPVIHGYAFALPSAPSGLITGVTSSRPTTTVAITVRGPGGLLKASRTLNGGAPYNVTMDVDIVGGDTVEVSVNGGPANPIMTVPITASVGDNQVAGKAAPNTGVVVGVGRVTGYVTKNSTYTYVQQRVSADASGAYNTGQIACGSAKHLELGPGSFGYTGYEDPHGNFIYAAFASPANYVMIDYPLVEGWVANGLMRPTITVRNSSNQVKDQKTATPMVSYLSNEKLYLNLYYVQFTAAYIEAGDNVQVTSGSTSVSISVPGQGLVGFLNDESNVVSGQGPAGATLTVIPADDKASRTDTVVDGAGHFAARNPYTSTRLTTCEESTKTEDFAQGDSGRIYLRYADGNAVFAFYGRAMSANENENRLELWIFPLRNIDWTTTPSRQATVTLTPKIGEPVTVTKELTGANGHGMVDITDADGTRALIRAGSSLRVTFSEGPNTLTRQATMSFDNIALLTASPDTESNTLAGVGPIGWPGRAQIISPVTSKASYIPAGLSAAYSPIAFVDSASRTITLDQGYAGKLSFSNDFGNSVWVAWAVTAIKVKITGWPRIGDTVVCGKAPPDSVVNIYDVTVPENPVLIGTGRSDGQGGFCVTVSPPLYKDEVIMAESSGSYSQPYQVREVFDLYLPMVRK